MLFRSDAAIFPVCVCTLLLPGRAGPPQDEHVDGNARAPHRRMRSVRPRLGLPKVVAPCCPPRPARPAYKKKESGGRAEGRGFLQSSGSERRGELPLPILLISLLFPTPHQEERRGGFGRERRRSRRDQLARLAFLPAPSSFSSSSLFWSDLVFFFLLAFNFSGWPASSIFGSPLRATYSDMLPVLNNFSGYVGVGFVSRSFNSISPELASFPAFLPA